MASLEDFNIRMAAIGERVTKNADKLVRKTAIVADQAVVSATPVDTGRAKSGWIAKVGAGSTKKQEAYSEGSHGSTSAENAAAALAQAEAVIATYRGGSSIHITNNVKYIGKLNTGTSFQAPANFVETAVGQAVAAVKRAEILRK